ncbi:MAG TPA: hypothetical protein V6C58_12105 [Allocoleopsis sp.]
MPNGKPPSANRSVSSTKESPAVVKEIPRQSSKDVKANSKKPESRERATVSASQLKPGRSKAVMLRKGERTTEGRPSPREIKNASAGIRKARFNAERERRARRVAKGLPAKVEPAIEKLIPKDPGRITPKQRDILNRSNVHQQTIRRQQELMRNK